MRTLEEKQAGGFPKPLYYSFSFAATVPSHTYKLWTGEIRSSDINHNVRLVLYHTVNCDELNSQEDDNLNPNQAVLDW
jgi:hypothetical protein